MANPYQPTDMDPTNPAPEDNISFREWVIITAILITATVGYLYYYSIHQNVDNPAIHQSVVSSQPPASTH